MSVYPKKTQKQFKISFKAYLICHLRDGVATLGGLWRAPLASLLTISVIAITLALPVTFLVLLNNTDLLTNQLNNQTQMSLFLKESVTPEQRLTLERQLLSKSYVTGVQVISPDSAVAELNATVEIQNALKILPKNPLPWTFVLIFDPTLPASQAEALFSELKDLPEIETASFDLEWLKRIKGIMTVAQQLTLAITALLSAAVLLVIGNTLRLNIESQRESIEVAKLIGATNAFVRRPFLYLGMWYGCLGALGAGGIVMVFMAVIRLSVAPLFLLYDSSFYLQGLTLKTSILLMGLGILLGMGGAWLAVFRQLHQLRAD
jgi:cell division transport system permease protein